MLLLLLLRLSPSRPWFVTYALVVDDLGNDGESAGVWSSAEEDDTADLDQSPLACLDVCVAHYVDVGGRSEEVR